jgi:hypothetical protein
MSEFGQYPTVHGENTYICDGEYSIAFLEVKIEFLNPLKLMADAWELRGFSFTAIGN